METKLIELKTDFNNIINIRTKVKSIFDILQSKISKLKELHAEFIKSNKTQLFIFGLDSFHFQSKLIDMEHEDMQRLFLAISNRMYCEYFKLYKIIIEYIMLNKNEKTLLNIKINNYPIYKDLEPYKEYNFETIQDIHENILNLVGVLISTLNNKENEFLLHKSKQSIGLNIDNFITTFNYSINVMKEKIIMFITYIQFFHKMHTKYLKRFSNKIELMYSHINHDIHFDDVKRSNNKTNTNNKINTDEEIEYTSESDYESNGSGSRSRTNSSISNITPKFKLNVEKEMKDDLSDEFSNINSFCDSILNKQQPESEEQIFDEESEEQNFKSEPNVQANIIDVSDNDIIIELVEPKKYE
jgi:hypothetical protein